MIEIITELFACDFKLSIKKDLNQCRITVIDRNTNLSFSQLLPIDHHLRDDNIKSCIIFCKNKLIQKLNG